MHRRPTSTALPMLLVLALMTTSFVSSSPAAAIDPLPADAPKAGDELVIDFHAEPEYLLIAGADRWNVRNTPDGTMASAYGVPEGAVHDLYAKTGRYEPLPAVPTGEILDVSVREKAPDFGLEHSWAFVRTSDGRAEIWGPADEAYPDRYVLERPVLFFFPEDIVGGTVLSDNAGTPTALVITRAGRVMKMTPGQEPVLVGTVGGDGETVVGAVARDHTDYHRPALNSDTPFDTRDQFLTSELLPGTSANPPEVPGQMVIVFSSGRFELVPLDGDVTDLASLANSPVPGSHTFDAASVAQTSNPIIDFDYSCFQGEYSHPNTYLGPRNESLEPFGDPVSDALGCPPGGDATTRDGEVRTLGRISVAVGLEDFLGTPIVQVLHSGDFVDYGIFRDIDAGTDVVATRTVTRHAPAKVACTFSPTEVVRAGTFDVRVLFATTYLACVRVDPDNVDRHLITTLVAPSLSEVRSQPRFARPLMGGSPLVWCGSFSTFEDIREEPTGCSVVGDGVSYTNSGVVQRRTFDRLAEIGDVVSADVPIVETYTDLESLSIQLEFPCERLLGRPLGSGPDDALFDCFSNKAHVGPNEDPNAVQASFPALSPNGLVSYAIAGYGRVDGERRLFVDHEPNVELFDFVREYGLEKDAFEADETYVPPTPTSPEDLSWVTEPAAHLGTDLQKLAGDPIGIDVSEFDAYAPPATGTPPPVLLTQIPRALRTPMRIRIDSAQPRVESRPSMPIAVLQAPPTVAGLGQQTDFTPEFATSQSTGSETTVSKATRVGTHFEIEGTVTVGAGALGNHVRAGGGAAASYTFMNEVEEDVTTAFEVETTEGYGGAFDDHTVVVRSILQYVWDATVIEDPAGFSTGQSFEYGIPAGEVTQAVPLSTLIEESPGLYGEGGAFRPTIDAITGSIRIGDPGSYPSGANLSRPPVILRSNGGPCNGGYADPGQATPVDGMLRAIVSPRNPYLSSDPKPPTGPDVVVSGLHLVSVGNELTESASITFSSSTSESKATSMSHDWGVTAIFKLEKEASAGASVAMELTISAGVDAGFSTGAGVSDSLGEGSGLSTVMGNIPFSPATKPWITDEQYGWRMYMCKVQLGPAGLGSEIWVQGYVVDGYNGSGGIETLAPVEAQAPVASAVAFADPTQVSSGTVRDCAAVGARDNRFQWEQQAGTVGRYAIELTNVTGGGGEQRVIVDLDRPTDFDPASGRVDCAGITAGDFVDGDLYRWRALVDGFVDNRETSDWEYFRPQVWPPSQTLSLRTPIIQPDDSVTIDIDNPAGVTSLRHDVTVLEIDPDTGSRSEVAAGRSIRTGTYRTPTLAPGRYEADVVGHNSHVYGSGPRADTPTVTVQFEVDETLRSQFSYGACSENPCNTSDEIEFTDASLPANDVPIVEWNWYFGDGTTSGQPNPTHRFTDLPTDGSNTYNVFLTVTDAAGQRASLRQEIPLQSAAPELHTDGLVTDIGVGQELTMTVTASDPDNVGRDPSALQIPTIEWDLDGDGSADVTEQAFESSVVRTFDAPGEYPVTVTATDPFGRVDIHTFNVTVHAPPTAAFTHTSCDAGGEPDDTPCTWAGVKVGFDPAPSSSTAGDIAAAEWDFGNGTTRLVTDPADQVVETTYRDAGTADVTLRVQDRLGQWSELTAQTIGIAGREPGAPTGLVAIAGPSFVEFSWSAPDDTGGSPITGYQVGVSNTSGCVLTLDPTPEEITVDTSYRFSPLVNGIEYRGCVAAINEFGTGPTVVSGPVTPSRAPAAPSDVDAIARDNSIELSWSAPATTGGSPITGYEIGVTDVDADSCATSSDLTSDDTEFTVTGLSSGTEYWVCVAAINEHGTGPAVTVGPMTPTAPVTEPEPEQPDVSEPEQPDGSEPAPSDGPQPAPAQGTEPVFTPVPPTRVLDTRTQRGFFTESWTGTSPTPSGTTITIPVGAASIPADATAVVVNLTTTRAVDAGYLTVYACDTPRPPTSNANFTPGDDTANLAIAPLSADGTICLYTSATADLIVDVFAHTEPDSGYTPTSPSRLGDTRTGSQPDPGSTVRVELPDADAHAITLTATRAQAPGYLTVHDCADPRPATSSVNYTPGEDVANLTVVAATELCVYTSAGADIIVDHHGTIDHASTTTQTRIIDTRAGDPLEPGTTIEVPDLVGTALVNLTTTGTITPGHLTIHDCTTAVPATSNTNTRVGHDVANLAITPDTVAGTGTICVTTTSTTHLIIDLATTLD